MRSAERYNALNSYMSVQPGSIKNTFQGFFKCIFALQTIRPQSASISVWKNRRGACLQCNRIDGSIYCELRDIKFV